MESHVPLSMTLIPTPNTHHGDEGVKNVKKGRRNEEEVLNLDNKWTIKRQKLQEISWSISSIGNVFTIISSLVFLLDFLSNILLCAFVFVKEDMNSVSYLWITSTLLLTIIPAIFVNFLSLMW